MLLGCAHSWRQVLCVCVSLLACLVLLSRAESMDSLPACSFDTPKDALCTLNVRQLKPTEFAYGPIEMEQTLRDTNERIKKGKFEAWAARTKVPIVIGPAKSQDEYSTTSVFDDVGAEFWVVDHHHRVLGVYRSDMAWNKKNLLCEVVQNYSHLSKHDFYRTIVNQQLVWLADQKGLYPLDPTLLPETFGHMHPDPYRDLAAYVRSRKGFHATSVLYAEFHWANYFRAVLPWPTHPQEERFTEWCKIRPYSSECTENGITEAQWIENVLPTALQMAHSPQASQLPGYIGSAQ